MPIDKSICFVATKDLNYKLSGGRTIKIKKAENLGRITQKDVYLTSPSAFKSTIPDSDQRTLKRVELGPVTSSTSIFSKTLKDVINSQQTAKVCLLNGFGLQLGDTLIGLSAMHSVLREHAINGLCFDIFTGPNEFSAIESLIKVLDPNTTVRVFPVTLNTLKSYDCVLDFSGLVRHPNFSKLNISDFYIERLGFSPQKIKDKTLIGPRYDALTKQNAKPQIYLAFDASGPLRSVPSDIRPLLFDCLKQHSDDFTFVTNKKFGEYPNWISDIGPESNDPASYMQQLLKCHGCISVDTSAYHFAESARVPALTLFTSISPDLRTKYYENNTSVVLPGADTASFWGCHGLKDEAMREELIATWRNVPREFWQSTFSQFLQSLNL